MRDATLGFAFLLIGAVPALAGVDRTLSDQGWKELTFRGRTPDGFKNGAEGAISVESADSVSVLYHPIEVDLKATPILTWTWCAKGSVPATDITRKGGDDRALAVYVGFKPGPDEDQGFLDFVKGLGGNVPSTVLTYVRGATNPTGRWLDNPYTPGSGFYRVLESRPTGACITEQVDVVADYRAAFGRPVPEPMQLAVSSDTDDTHSRVDGEVRGLRFVAARH